MARVSGSANGAGSGPAAPLSSGQGAGEYQPPSSSAGIRGTGLTWSPARAHPTGGAAVPPGSPAAACPLTSPGEGSARRPAGPASAVGRPAAEGCGARLGAGPGRCRPVPGPGLAAERAGSARRAPERLAAGCQAPAPEPADAWRPEPSWPGPAGRLPCGGCWTRSIQPAGAVTPGQGSPPSAAAGSAAGAGRFARSGCPLRFPGRAVFPVSSVTSHLTHHAIASGRLTVALLRHRTPGQRAPESSRRARSPEIPVRPRPGAARKSSSSTACDGQHPRASSRKPAAQVLSSARSAIFHLVRLT